MVEMRYSDNINISVTLLLVSIVLYPSLVDIPGSW